jgi:hypothetical protein
MQVTGMSNQIIVQVYPSMVEKKKITAFSHQVCSMLLNELSELNNSECTVLTEFLCGGNSVCLTFRMSQQGR